MAQRIAKRTTAGVSIWDVHVEVKEGKVAFDAKDAILGRWLGYMLSGGKNTITPNLQWDESLRKLLALFQDHVDDGITILRNVKSLHYLKFSLLKRLNEKGQDRTFFCFCTQFDDDTTPPDEQAYIDDMYQQYGALLELVWHHCKDVDELLNIKATLKEPPDWSVDARVQGFELGDAFLKIVDSSNVDRDQQLCFFNANPYVTSSNIKDWQTDHLKLSKASVAASEARIERQKPFADPAKILGDLILALDKAKV